MPCRLLIQKTFNPNNATDRRYYQKGDIVLVEPDGWEFTAADLAYKVVVNISDATYAQAQAYIENWWTVISFSKSVLSLPNDEWRVSVTANKARASDNYGGLTKTKVDNWLARWNITSTEVSANDVTFDARVYDTIISYGFIGRTLQATEAQHAQVIFQETRYDSGTGEHDVEADYSVPNWPSNVVANRIGSKFDIVSHDTINKKIIFTVDREQHVFSVFKDSAQESLDEQLWKRRYRISEADVDAIVDAGGEVTRTKAQVLAALIDATTE